MSKTRFTKPMYPTVYFSENILGKCPKCEGPCFVKTKLSKYTLPFPSDYSSSLHCQQCGFTKNKDEKWFGYCQGLLKIHCGFCGNKLLYSTKPTKKPYKKLSVKCPKCNVEKCYPLTWYRYKGNKPTDPYFGLELWLQVPVKDHILWVYNDAHLKYLKEYVSSDLREDDARHKYSLVSNLPQWIKSAKNKNLILKKLDILEEKLIKAGY
ncbi:hypothetical protein [Sulfurovum mangrovi]|uniref:hypothetical protein n=1 Tax=Sulfurovum mangrovi TaxID=2893889 RepID=UPI001E6038A4|nr:hypothetical protein [Sulfurovum mangrovi]UFH58124.1 hypothetical protein LN246_07140 [Sulfurovum mangrovi]